MMAKKKQKVNGIITKGVEDWEYMFIYRARTLDEQIQKAAELNVLDRDYYKRLFKALRQVDPEFKKIFGFAVVCLVFNTTLFLFKAAAMAL